MKSNPATPDTITGRWKRAPGPSDHARTREVAR
jgi:hypothetical protein